MTNKAAPTQRQRSELARRKAMGIALIQKPLRHIRAKTNTIEVDAKGEKYLARSVYTILAEFAADRGDGAEVQRLARLVVR